MKKTASTVTSTDFSSLSAKAMEISREGVLITDADTKILDVNPAMCEITGYEKGQIIGDTPRIFQSGCHSKRFYQKMWASLKNEGQWQGEIWDRKKSGEITPCQMRIKAIIDDKAHVSHYIGLLHDSSKLLAAIELANKDPLTDLFNRRLFDERLQQAARHAKRSGKPFTLLYIDLDKFKKVNDQWGHMVGDRVLKIIAARLEDSIREEDTVARLGGDEFAVILADIGDQTDIEMICHKMIINIDKLCIVDDHQFIPACTIGYSIYPDYTDNISQLIYLADQDMYLKKKRCPKVVLSVV